MKRFATLLVLSLMAALLPAGSAAAAPAIAILNPSPYTATQIPEISDKGGLPVHFVAWVQDVPLEPLVEFEIKAVQSSLPGQNVATVDAQRVGTDTWEGFFFIPDNFAEGSYTVDARLYSQLDQVAEDQQVVTVNQSDTIPPAAAETVEMIQPDNGGPLGFFTPLGKATNAVINATVSSGTRQVRALYTTSAPGTEPAWTPCGSGAPNANLFVAVRCTLKDGDNSAQVNAVAAVANTTPRPAPPDPAADDAGDAHRIVSYTQTPASIAIDPEGSTQKSGECQVLTAFLFDQLSRVIAGANIDVHAEGPNDQLTFATDDIAGGELANTDDYKAPDQGHVSEEPTIRCSDEAGSGSEQGVHRIIGTADRQHIESVAGTNNDGSFIFALHSGSPGTTSVTAFADVNDDDSQSLSEASGAAGIGWDQDPPPPRRELFIDPDAATAETGSCQTLTLVAREGGSALVGANVDIHVAGPDASVTFCTPIGGNETRRAPDQGGHLGDTHTDSGTKHAEGETDSSGRFVFGVTAASDGRTDVFAWIDETDDDVFATSEPAAPAQVTFGPRGDRSISLEASRNRVRKGRKVRLFGAIDGAPACSADQKVRLQARIPGRKFKLIKATTTNTEGEYSFRVRVRYTKDYRTIAVKDGVCERTRSNTVRVRAKR